MRREKKFFSLSLALSLARCSFTSLSFLFTLPPARRPQTLGSLSKELKMVRESDELVLACRPPCPPQEKAGEEAEERLVRRSKKKKSDGCPLSDRAKKKSAEQQPCSLRRCLLLKNRESKIAPSRSVALSLFSPVFFSRGGPFSTSSLPPESQNRNGKNSLTRSTTTSTSSRPNRARR